ncbi:MAG: hypothetical protein JRG96_03735 [Deltaproteobacteria bacterium]|nr:hypothetical protein [Deltaproteobacteria bacterium]MBW2420936.1 hypothetical protein [Deltaproteobacteria bacterium]
MPIPDRKRLKQFAKDYIALWNAGDKEGWIRNWRAVCTGEFRMLDPVGTPEKHGFKECCEDSWELFNDRVKFKHHDDIVLVNGNELAWVLENRITTDGKTITGISIETFRFEEDGSVMIRTWYEVPDRDTTELGDMFETYLPE